METGIESVLEYSVLADVCTLYIICCRLWGMGTADIHLVSWPISAHNLNGAHPVALNLFLSGLWSHYCSIILILNSNSALWHFTKSLMSEWHHG
jgi:hypothetical protein